MLAVEIDTLGLTGNLTLTSCSGNIPKISFREAQLNAGSTEKE